MGRKKKSLAARAAQQQQPSEEAATTSQQVPAQSGPQTQAAVQPSRPQTAQSETTAQGAPGQTASRPKGQGRAPQRSGPAAPTPQPASPPVRASPPYSGPTIQQAPSEPRGPLRPPFQPAAPVASPQPRGWGQPPSAFQIQQQQQYQPVPPGPRYFSPDLAQQQPGPHTLHQPRAPPPGFAPDPRGLSRPPMPIPAQPVYGQGEPPIRGPRAWGPTAPVQTQPSAWGSSPVQPAAPGTTPHMAAGIPQAPQPSHYQPAAHGPPPSVASGTQQPSQLQPTPPVASSSSKKLTLTEKTQSELGQLALGSEQKSPRPKYTEVCRYTIPNKIPGRSVRFQPINLLCNYFPMTLSPIGLIRYDISFKPDKPKKLVKLAYEKMKRDLFPRAVMAFDQSKICIVKEPLPGVGERFVTNIEVTDENHRTINFEVIIVHTGVLNFNTLIQYTKNPASSLNPPTEVIQLLDIILRQGTLESYTKAGRQFFKRPSRPVDLGYGLEMWTGLFQSAIITNKIFINVDVAHKGFPKNKKLIDLLREDFRLDPSKKIENQRFSDKFLDFLKGLRVVVPIYSETTRGSVTPREFIVNSLQESPVTETFDYTDPQGGTKRISVLDFFRHIKGVNIQYPNLNCLWVGPKDKRILYPLELVTVALGQVRNKQLNDEQLSKMVRTAAAPPEDRVRKIQEIIREIKYSTNPQYRHFGLTIDDRNFHTVAGKILENPKIDNGQKQQPMDGAWNFHKLCNPVPFPPWVYVTLECGDDNSSEIIGMITAEAGRLGIRVGKPFTANVQYRQQLAACLTSFVSKGCKLAVVVISTQKDIYHHVKTVAECNVGMLTQCLKLNTVKTKLNKTTIKNILLKVNAKLMGINHKISQECVPRSLSEKDLVMIVGADVTHPSPDQRTVPSIAAVISSVNNTHTIYNIEMSIQAARVEIISQFQEMMKDHFDNYKSVNGGKLPVKIYVYRDGVSEGQFAQVLNEELTALYNAYKSAGGQKRPNVLFLLVQKRHHTRLFDEVRLNNTQLRNRNVVPGTLVDVDIVHPSELDFYLVSHQAIKGTARPTRYHQIYNDLKIPDDEVQQMTHYLCHLFARCARSVSYPAPTYYAHLACLRARSLTYNTQFNMADLERQPKRLQVHNNLKSLTTMFFV